MSDTRHLATSKISKYAALLWAALFVFFLAYSAPHRVHHFFEQASNLSLNHSHDDQNQPKHHDSRPASGSDCVFQVSASRCAANLTAQVDTPTLIESPETPTVFAPNRSPQSSPNTPFQIRAPPQL